MINRETPSKSEVMSIAHSASIGADCIMLSEETAVSPNAKLILGWLDGFGKEIEHIKPKLSSSSNEGRYKLIWNALSNFPSIPVLIVSKSGYAIFDYFATNPQSELFLVSETKKIIKLTMLYRNSIEVIKRKIGNNTPIDTVWKVIEENKLDLFRHFDQVVAIFVSRYVNTPRANSLTIFDKVDFEKKPDTK
jgi:pyruvate kinase